jgi:hypothetical protein
LVIQLEGNIIKYKIVHTIQENKYFHMEMVILIGDIKIKYGNGHPNLKKLESKPTFGHIQFKNP